MPMIVPSGDKGNHKSVPLQNGFMRRGWRASAVDH
jgi:hypothetical protein